MNDSSAPPEICCPNCAAIVPKARPRCPNCGARWDNNPQNVWLWRLRFIAGILAIFAALLGTIGSCITAVAALNLHGDISFRDAPFIALGIGALLGAGLLLWLIPRVLQRKPFL